MNEESQQWLEQAQQDLRAAEVLLDAGIWNQVCFHAQQCVEKLFKAAIVAEGRLYPRSHNLIGLLNALDGVESEALAALTDQIRLLDRFYTSTRYPDIMPGAMPADLPSRDDAADALALARQVTQIISDALHATGAQ